MDRQPLIKLSRISGGYEGKIVLRNVNLEIYPNDFLGIIGPNGGGKTTLIKMILGLLKPASGDIAYSLQGKRTNEISIGYLPQYNTIDKKFPISVYEVVLSGLNKQKSLFRPFTTEQHAQVQRTIARMGLQGLEKRAIGQLSGGQMQRVAIARALVNNPAVILADEATGNLDTRTSFEILVLFQKLHAEGRTIIFVTHNPDIANYSSRNIMLRDGVIISDKINDNILSAEEGLAALPAKSDE